MKVQRTFGVVSTAIVILAGCNRSDKPSAVRTPDAAGTSGASSATASPSDTVLDPFDREIRSYIDQTQPLRQEAAKPAATLTAPARR